MNDDTAQQLRLLDLKKVLGAGGGEEDFGEGVKDLVSTVWALFLEEVVSPALTEDQIGRLSDLLARENPSQEEMIGLFKEAVPDFDQRFQQKVLEVKEGVVRGRVDGLMAEAGDNEQKKAALGEVVSLMDQGQWAQVEDKLAAF